MSDKTKVLVIDDDPIVLEVVKERLEGAGYDVTTRTEALGTTQAVRETSPDVVLLDIMMPALSGERIAELLRSNARTGDVGIILHSSKTDEELEPLIAQTGALGAISKSHDEGEFLSRFRMLLRKRG
ncbi:MAG: response regulator [Myxococcales bacterium]